MTLSPSEVDVVFQCEDCERIKKDWVANVIYNGPPSCCGVQMMLLNVETKAPVAQPE